MFFICDTDKICLTRAQADLLAEYFYKLNAIEAARRSNELRTTRSPR